MTTQTAGRMVLAATLAIALAGCGSKEEEPAKIVPVKVAPAIRGTIRRIVAADAVLYPRDQANLAAKIAAPVRRFLVNRGDHVKAGQLVAELENRDLKASAAASHGQFAQAEAGLRSTTAVGIPEQVTKAQSDVEAARQALDAAKKLVDSREQLYREGALARRLVDEAQVVYAQAKAQFDTEQQHLAALQNVGRAEQTKSAEAQLETAKGQYEAAEAQVGYSEIRSPITGVVTDRTLYAGEMANAGGTLLTVMDMSAVVARANLPPDEARSIRVGASATLTVGANGEPVPGKVTVVSPAVDPNSTTVQVWVQADNPGERLHAGTSVHVTILAAMLDDATLVAAPAILPGPEGGSIVLVVDDKDVAHQKKVEVGPTDGDLVQIVSGVQPGERVVTVGGVGLEDRAKVHVLAPGEKAPGEEGDTDEDER